jgi:DNA-binding XRE family transcriptional regulator
VSQALATFALRMREHRTRHGYTQDDVAGMVGLTRASITNLENGRQDTTLTRAALIADALGTTLAAMLT